MPFPANLQAALTQYNEKKGFFRKLFSDQPAIQAMQLLPEAKKADLPSIYQCFLDNPPSPSQASYQVYLAVIGELNNTYAWREDFEKYLDEYEQEKGFFTRLFGDIAPIKAIRRLSAEDRLNPEKLIIALRQSGYYGLDLPLQGAYKSLLRINPSQTYVNPIDFNDLLSELEKDKGHDFPRFAYPSLITVNPSRTYLYEYEVDDLFSKLEDNNLYTEANIKIIRTHPQRQTFANIFELLDNNKLLNQSIIDAAAQPENTNTLLEALKILKERKLLSQENTNTVAQHRDIQTLLNIFETLRCCDQLTQENINTVAQHKDLKKLLNIFKALRYRDQLTQENINTVVRHKDLKTLSDTFEMLTKNALLKASIIVTTIQHSDPKTLFKIFGMVIQMRFSEYYEEELIKKVMQHKDISTLQNIYLMLGKGNCMREYIKDATKNKNPKIILKTLEALDETNLLTGDPGYADNIRYVFRHDDLDDARFRIFDKLKQNNLLTQNNFDAVTNKNFNTLLNIFELLEKHNILTAPNITATIHYYRNLDRLLNTLKILEQNNLLTQDNIPTVMQHDDLYQLLKVFDKLNKNDLLTSKNTASLIMLHNFKSIKLCLSALEDGNILTQGNLDAVLKHRDPYRNHNSLARAFIVLQQAERLTQENVNAVIQHRNPGELAEAFIVLQQANLLTQTNLDAVLQHQNPLGLAHAFIALQQADLFSAENRSAVILQTQLGSLGEALLALQQAECLTQKNLNAVLQHQNPSVLARAFIALQQADLFSAENRSAVLQHQDPCGPALVFISLQQAERLTQENLNAVLQHQNPTNLALSLGSLQHAGLLTQVNLDAVLQHQNPSNLALSLAILLPAGLLTQVNLDALLDPRHAYLLTVRGVQFVWSRIPVHLHLLTQNVFNQLTRLAEQQDPEAAIRNYVDNLIGVRRDRRRQAAVLLNEGQSTHTASVHQSVSESAAKLFKRYGKQLKNGLEGILERAKQFVQSKAADSLKNQAAQHGIARLINQTSDYEDKVSGITTRQLLALSYLAIQDQKLSSADPEDAKALFIDGLYEIQRGYNISAAGVDDGKEDRPICAAGTFNKLVEKLQGIHPEAKVKMINKALASMKLPKVVKEEAEIYLTEQANAQTTQQFSSFIEVIKAIKQDGIEVIWKAIRSRISNRLFDEFGTLYKGKNDPNFCALIEAGTCTELDNLNKFQQTLESSKGHHQYCMQTLRHSGLFASRQSMVNHLSEQRHSSPEAQKAYDEQFGLVLRK